MAYAPANQYPKPITVQSGPWSGMRDALDPTAAAADKVTYAQNMVIAPGPQGRAYIGRPGFEAMGAGTSPLGPSASRRVGQAIKTWTRQNGSRLTVAVVGGNVYTWDPPTDVWTHALTDAHLAAAGVVLSQSVRVALVPFYDGQDRLVVSDGVNTPWMWTGVVGGGITKLTNAPIFYGPPVVYYGKLVGIKANERNTIVWSEEGLPNEGYEATIGNRTYVNAWTVGQNAGADRVFALAATNEALVVFRETSITRVSGAIASDFKTAGTQSDVSSRIGTRSPWSVDVLDRGIAFLDSEGRPTVLGPDGSIAEIWRDARETIKRIPNATLENAVGIAIPSCHAFLFGVADVGETNPNLWLAFDIESFTFQSVWVGFTAGAVGNIWSAQNPRRWAFLAPSSGMAYRHGCLENGPWSDAGVAIEHIVRAQFFFRDLTAESRIASIEWGLNSPVDVTVNITNETSRGQGSVQTANVVTAFGSVYDVAEYDVDTYAYETRDQRVKVGRLEYGRWCRPEVRHSGLNEIFSVMDCRVMARERRSAPNVP